MALAKIQLPADAPMGRWSWNNQALAYLQTDSLDCRGFRQWQEANRQVRKGTHAAYILRPCFKKIRDGDEERQILTGRIGQDVHPYHNTDPVEGKKDVALEYAPRELPPLAEIAARLGVVLAWSPGPPSVGGWCAPDGTQIELHSEDVRVMAHELGHALHAKIAGKLKGGQHNDQEVIAEFAGCVLCALYDLGDRTGDAWKYIKSYAENPVTAVYGAMGTVGAILGWLEGNDENADES